MGYTLCEKKKKTTDKRIQLIHVAIAAPTKPKYGIITRFNIILINAIQMPI